MVIQITEINKQNCLQNTGVSDHFAVAFQRINSLEAILYPHFPTVKLLPVVISP